MKVLDFHQSPPDDELRLGFEGACDVDADLDRELEPFLQALETYAGGWMPEVVSGRWARKYSRDAIRKGLDERRNEYGMRIGLHRTKPPAMDGMLYLGLGAVRSKLDIVLRLKPLAFFAEEDRCRAFVEMVRAWASRYPVIYAEANSLAEDELAGAPCYGRDQETFVRDGIDKVYDVCWLNVFGPKLLESVGRQRVLSTPAHRVEELPGGAVLLVTWPVAAEFARDEARQAQARALAHLRPDLDHDTVLRTLRERSARLVPVEPHFHADLAPLLSRVVDVAPISERQTRIAHFNAYRPPEPDEWLPAETAPSSDVADREAALKNISFVAEHLVALLHTKVPAVFEESPASLVDLDFHFWRENFPEVFERKNIDESLVPPIGAYLGQVLVRNLGGEWVPRKKLEESQVRVGGRAWLPFVRAWRYMRTRQALLDHSLTQFYREAERHRG